MYTLSTDGVTELERETLHDVRGGNPAIALGTIVATSFGWGLRYGYTVVGPWLMGHERG